MLKIIFNAFCASLCSFLPCSHARFNHVYYIVAKFLALADDVHIEGAHGVGILMIVYIIDILAAQLVAIVVYFVFNIKLAVYIEIVFSSEQQCVHLREAVVGEFKHLVHVLILLLCKVFLARHLAVDGACDVIATIADALQF